jgi:hypothetical protein
MYLNDPFWKWRPVMAPSDALGAGDGASSGEDDAAGGLPAPEPSADAAPAPGAPEGEPPAEEPKAPQQKPWFTQRIDRLTREKYEIARERDAAIAAVQQLRARAVPQAQQEVDQEIQRQQAMGRQGPSQAQVEAMVAQRAYAIAEAERFTDRCNEVYEQGEKVAGFKEALGVLQSNFGSFDPVYGNVALPYDFLQMVVDTPDPIGVIQKLGQNPAMAERIFNEPNPIRRATQIASLAVGGRQVSKAPGPVKGLVGGNAGSAPSSLYDDNLPLDKWMEQREKQVRERARGR